MFRVSKSFNGRWSVCLPHQCDDWEIAYSETQEDALALLDQFIKEAKEARKNLAAGEQLNVDW